MLYKVSFNNNDELRGILDNRGNGELIPADQKVVTAFDNIPSCSDLLRVIDIDRSSLRCLIKVGTTVLTATCGNRHSQYKLHYRLVTLLETQSRLCVKTSFKTIMTLFLQLCCTPSLVSLTGTSKTLN